MLKTNILTSLKTQKKSNKNLKIKLTRANHYYKKIVSSKNRLKTYKNLKR